MSLPAGLVVAGWSVAGVRAGLNWDGRLREGEEGEVWASCEFDDTCLIVGVIGGLRAKVVILSCLGVKELSQLAEKAVVIGRWGLTNCDLLSLVLSVE